MDILTLRISIGKPDALGYTSVSVNGMPSHWRIKRVGLHPYAHYDVCFRGLKLDSVGRYDEAKRRLLKLIQEQ